MGQPVPEPNKVLNWDGTYICIYMHTHVCYVYACIERPKKAIETEMRVSPKKKRRTEEEETTEELKNRNN